MRPLPPTPCAPRRGEGPGQTELQARIRAQTSTSRLHQQLSLARPKTAPVGPKMVAADDSQAKREQTTIVFQAQSKTPPIDNRPTYRVPRVDPESLPPASGSKRPT